MPPNKRNVNVNGLLFHYNGIRRNLAIANRSRHLRTQSNSSKLRVFHGKSVSQSMKHMGHRCWRPRSPRPLTGSFYRVRTICDSLAMVAAATRQKIAKFIYSICTQRPRRRGWPRRISQKKCLVYRKTRMIGLPYAEEDLMMRWSRFGTTWERDWRTDGRTELLSLGLYQYRASAVLHWRAIKIGLMSR